MEKQKMDQREISELVTGYYACAGTILFLLLLVILLANTKDYWFDYVVKYIRIIFNYYGGLFK
jgi:hypothetical protein